VNDDESRLRREIERLHEQLVAEGVTQLDLANEASDLRRALTMLAATVLGAPDLPRHVTHAAVEAARVLRRHGPVGPVPLEIDPAFAPMDDDGEHD
jgi:hypothetical protein